MEDSIKYFTEAFFSLTRIRMVFGLYQKFNEVKRVEEILHTTGTQIEVQNNYWAGDTVLKILETWRGWGEGGGGKKQYLQHT